MIRAMSSRLAMMRSNQRLKICARSFGNVFAEARGLGEDRAGRWVGDRASPLPHPFSVDKALAFQERGISEFHRAPPGVEGLKGGGGAKVRPGPLSGRVPGDHRKGPGYFRGSPEPEQGRPHRL